MTKTVPTAQAKHATAPARQRSATATAALQGAASPADRQGDASPWPPASDRAQQRMAKRDAVLSTAAQMFNERGFHATSMDDVAARLNVTKPTLYYYFKNKDEILLACMRRGLNITLEGIEASRQAGGNALDQLRACMAVYSRIMMEPFGACVIRVGEEQVPPESRKELRRMKASIDQAFRRLVSQGVEEGSLAPCDPKMTAFVIAGALSWIARWYQADGEQSVEEIVERCIKTLLDGLLKRSDAPAKGSPKSRDRTHMKNLKPPNEKR